MRDRVDELQKKVRGIDELERRVAALEQRLEEVSGPKRRRRACEADDREGDDAGAEAQAAGGRRHAGVDRSRRRRRARASRRSPARQAGTRTRSAFGTTSKRDGRRPGLLAVELDRQRRRGLDSRPAPRRSSAFGWERCVPR